MTSAIDDVDAIRKAREAIAGQVTTTDTPSSCAKCGDMRFVFDERGFGARAIPCPVCRPRKEPAT